MDFVEMHANSYDIPVDFVEMHANWFEYHVVIKC